MEGTPQKLTWWSKHHRPQKFYEILHHTEVFKDSEVMHVPRGVHQQAQQRSQS